MFVAQKPFAENQSSADWSDLRGLMGPKHQAVLYQINILLHRRFPELRDANALPEDARLLLNRAWREIEEANGMYKASMVLKQAPVEPKLDWRPELRRLKNQPQLLETYLGDDQYRELLVNGYQYVTDDPVEDWDRALQESPELLSQTIDALLENEILRERGGPEDDAALDDFLEAVAKVYLYLAHKPVGLSRFALDKDKAGRPGGPAFQFLRVCIDLVRPEVTDEGLAYRLKKLMTAKTSRKSRKKL